MPEAQQPPQDPLARQLWQLWQQGQPPAVDAFLAHRGELTAQQLLATLRVDQHHRWRAGERPTAEDYLRLFPTLRSEAATAQLVYDEILLRQERREVVELN